MRAFRIEKMECYLWKEETQMYIIGTCEPDLPSSLHIRCRINISVLHRYQSLYFELHLYSESYWAMITTEYLILNGRFDNLITKLLRDKEIVNSPTDIPFSNFWHEGPP